MRMALSVQRKPQGSPVDPCWRPAWPVGALVRGVRCPQAAPVAALVCLVRRKGGTWGVPPLSLQGTLEKAHPLETHSLS